MLSTPHRPTSLAVLTSGGDAAGMNAAVRAVVRSGLDAGLRVFAVHDGLQGLVDGGDAIRQVDSTDVGGILQQGGTVLGTARCEEFRTRDGRRVAARNLIVHKIDTLMRLAPSGEVAGSREGEELLFLDPSNSKILDDERFRLQVRHAWRFGQRFGISTLNFI